MRNTGSVWDSVGNTPLIKIKSLSELTGCEIYGKAEFLNPGGSVKDRAAKGIISKAEQEGKLQPGGMIVEGTVSSTGIGLATLAAERGYRVLVTMPNNQAQEKYQALESIGAEIRAVPPALLMMRTIFITRPVVLPRSWARYGPINLRIQPTRASIMKPPARKSGTSWKAKSIYWPHRRVPVVPSAG